MGMSRWHTTAGIVLIVWTAQAQPEHVSIEAAMRPGDQSYIVATGEKTISAKPDQAIIDVGVVTQGPAAASVAAQNAKQSDEVVAELHKILSAGDQVKTTGYSVRPNYAAPKPGAAPSIAGYTATNTVEVTLGDITQVGKAIDAALQSGANNIQSLRFGLKNPQAVRSQALREAAAQAKANAEAIAAGLGVRVMRVLSAEENGPEAANFKFATPAAAALSVQTPVEPGTVDVSASITLKLEVAQ